MSNPIEMSLAKIYSPLTTRMLRTHFGYQVSVGCDVEIRTLEEGEIVGPVLNKITKQIDDQLKASPVVKEIIQQNVVQLKRLQDQIDELSNEAKRLEQYETFYKLLKEVRSI